MLPDRLPTVLRVVYLVFNEGYAASAGDDLVRRDLCAEAIRLAKLLCVLMPDEPEALGLLALLLLQDSRREARVDGAGELVLLDEQDRALWDANEIAEGLRMLHRALALGRSGPVPAAGADRRRPRGEHRVGDDRARVRRARERTTARPSSASTAPSPWRWPATSSGGLAMIDGIDGLDRLLVPARGTGGSPAPRREDRRGGRCVPARARADRQRGRAPIPLTQARRDVSADPCGGDFHCAVARGGRQRDSCASARRDRRRAH